MHLVWVLYRSFTQDIARISLTTDLNELDEEEKLRFLLGNFPINRQAVLDTVG